MPEIFLIEKYSESFLIEYSSRSIREGKTLILPTDTVYGISGDYFNKGTRKKIAAIKNRPLDKSFIVLLSSISDIIKYTNQQIPEFVIQSMTKPLTIVVKNKHHSLYGERTLAIRIPQHPLLKKIIAETETAITSTSVNQSDQLEPETTEELILQFKDKVDIILLEKIKKQGLPSTILDISEKPFKLLRQGEFIVPDKWLE